MLDAYASSVRNAYAYAYEYAYAYAYALRVRFAQRQGGKNAYTYAFKSAISRILEFQNSRIPESGIRNSGIPGSWNSGNGQFEGRNTDTTSALKLAISRIPESRDPKIVDYLLYADCIV